MKKIALSIQAFFKRTLINIDKKIRPDEKVVNDFLSDPKVIENCRESANYFSKIFAKQWFTATKATRMQRIYKTEGETMEILNLLCLTQFAVSKVDSGLQHFQITLNTKDRIKTYQQMLRDIDVEKGKIQKEIDKLEKQS